MAEQHSPATVMLRVQKKDRSKVKPVTSVSKWWMLTSTPFTILFWVSVGWLIFLSFSIPSLYSLYEPGFTWDNYVRIFTSDVYMGTLIDTLWMAFVGSAIAVIVAYPLAFHISRNAGKARSVYMGIVFMVLLVSFLIKMYAWQILLADNSVLSSFLAGFGLPDTLLGTKAGVIMGLVYASLPYTVLALTASIDQVPRAVEEASAVFGASPRKVFSTVVFPMTAQGLTTALIFAVPLNLSAFLAPVLLGRGQVQMTALQIFTSSAGGGSAGNWPLASALSITLLIISGILTFGVLHMVQRKGIK